MFLADPTRKELCVTMSDRIRIELWICSGNVTPKPNTDSSNGQLTCATPIQTTAPPSVPRVRQVSSFLRECEGSLSLFTVIDSDDGVAGKVFNACLIFQTA